jgi:hypothetical protein
MSTFDNWTLVYYTVAHGCLNYPGDYSSVSFVDPTIHTAFGLFPEPVCTSSAGQPIVSAVVFISFAIIEGYILVSLNLAAVAIGINERLAQLRDLAEFGDLDDEEDCGGSKLPPDRGKVGGTPNNKATNSKAAKLLGSKTGKESREIAAILAKIWDLPQTGGNDMNEIFKVKDLSSLAINIKLFAVGGWHEPVYSVFVFLDAVLQFVDENSADGVDPSLLPGHWFFQAVFLVDIIVRCVSHSDNPKGMLKDNWAIFTILLTALNFIPLCYPTSKYVGYNIFAAFRILRLTAILKTFRFMPDLACILNAIDMSYLCLIYVIALMGLFLCYFAIAGVLLFKSALPFYFNSIGASLFSLVECMTQDNWSVLMRMAMYGCSNYGFNSGVHQFDASCITEGTRGDGVGYWSPIFFVLFIVVASMVLVSLLVGVIITSLELDREDLLEEEEVMAKLKVVQRRYHLQQAQITMLLHLFEKCDANADGALTYEELVIVLDSMKMDSAEQFQFFLRVDSDKSGQIDFSEFCEMIALLGLGKKANAMAKQPSPLQVQTVVAAPEETVSSSKSSRPGAAIVKGISQVRDVIGRVANVAAAEFLKDTKGNDEDDSLRYSRRSTRNKHMSNKVAPYSSLKSSLPPSISMMQKSVVIPVKEEDELAELGEIKSDDVPPVSPVRKAYELVPSDPTNNQTPFDVRHFEDLHDFASQKSAHHSEHHSRHSSNNHSHIGAFSRPHQDKNDLKYKMSGTGFRSNDGDSV